jgi:hypothetical protein
MGSIRFYWPGEVCRPGEHHESDCGVVMHKHLPEILKDKKYKNKK